jgi:hypothetical protein
MKFDIYFIQNIAQVVLKASCGDNKVVEGVGKPG